MSSVGVGAVWDEAYRGEEGAGAVVAVEGVGRARRQQEDRNGNQDGQQ